VSISVFRWCVCCASCCYIVVPTCTVLLFYHNLVLICNTLCLFLLVLFWVYDTQAESIHSSKPLYTCPLWPPIGLWCKDQVSGTWNDWRPLYTSGDGESFVFFFRPYVGLHTCSWSSSLRGQHSKFIWWVLREQQCLCTFLILVTYILVRATIWSLWKLHCLATSSPSLHTTKSDPNPGQTVSEIRPTGGIYSEDTAPEQYVLCVILPYSTFYIYCQLVTHDAPLMIAWVECLILAYYY
jgi:hypothetical protein